MKDPFKEFEDRPEEPVEEKPRYERQQPSLHTVNMDDLKTQNHLWVDRGEVMSCEGGDHPAHRAFKKRR